MTTATEPKGNMSKFFDGVTTPMRKEASDEEFWAWVGAAATFFVLGNSIGRVRANQGKPEAFELGQTLYIL